MVACGTSGLFGGRLVPAERMFAPLAFPVADNSLIPFVFALGFLVVAFVVFLLDVFLLAIFLSSFSRSFGCWTRR
jgi:hypothetical protein